MMDLKKLKHLNILERLGFYMQNKPKQSIIWFSSIITGLILVLMIPLFVNMAQTGIAKYYINSTKKQINEINKITEEKITLLNGKQKMKFKEYQRYQDTFLGFEKQINEFNSVIENLSKDLEQKRVKKVIKAFSSDKEYIAFDTRVENVKVNVLNISNEVQRIVDLDQELKKDYVDMHKWDKELKNKEHDFARKQHEILIQAKNERVKTKATNILRGLESDQGKAIVQLNKLVVYSESTAGTYTINELEKIKVQVNEVKRQWNKALQTSANYENYWNELQEQYYTIVTRNFYERTTENVIEPNPMYKEWTETESYTDTVTKYKTESYTERVYVGSRIVGEHKEDIYENQQKTKQVPYQEVVNKTRQVSKDNGQPRTIPVPYDLFKHYYEIEKHTLSGTYTTKEYVGKKHEKYDINIRSWRYEEKEKVGYIVWKQKFNDNQGIVKGTYVHPNFE